MIRLVFVSVLLGLLLIALSLAVWWQSRPLPAFGTFVGGGMVVKYYQRVSVDIPLSWRSGDSAGPPPLDPSMARYIWRGCLSEAGVPLSEHRPEFDACVRTALPGRTVDPDELVRRFGDRL